MSEVPSSRLVCVGCGWEAPSDAATPFACGARAPGDDVEHVLEVVLSGAVPARDGASPSGDRDVEAPALDADHDPQPFVRFRHRLHAWRRARADGESDEAFVARVRALDAAVAAVDGTGFRATSCERSAALSDALGFVAPGGVWVKDETRNVSGSHKGRHLFNVALWLDTVGVPRDTPLAVASCGNAALAAGVVAKAAGRPLEVFVPPWGDAGTLARLRELGATLHVCERRETDPPGDPCLHRFREALAAGALPFTVQGPENGLAVEGGCTLGWELALIGDFDRLFVQVGGGALASSAARALEQAVAEGALAALPKLHAVQTRGGHPLERAWTKLAADTRGQPPERALAHAAAHRSTYMWPWETEPTSLASGILDDETYDWLGVVRGMLHSGGSPVVVEEGQLEAALRVGRASTGLPVCATGVAGLAGLMALRAAGEVADNERVCVLFTGRERGAAPEESR